MEGRERSLFWLLGAVGINRLCSLVPAYVYFDPFPFYNILDAEGNNVGLTVQSYIYGISTHAIVMALIHLLAVFSSAKYWQLFTILFVLECASLIDYILIYEHPFLYKIEFTDIKIIIYTLVIIKWTK